MIRVALALLLCGTTSALRLDAQPRPRQHSRRVKDSPVAVLEGLGVLSIGVAGASVVGLPALILGINGFIFRDGDPAADPTGAYS